ncbi:zinc finger MYM-type protein 2 isoform X1 [Oncorhynchus kisutch]|uniref:Zinc finger MYM-type containing 2 n=1 Tax=Oncorhynchus kisutch TaxID=8019 RepID=A0A8C7C9G2_ONCKI|nr:zinc finger MYM-type protein 2 isoform X1 [Oncorhynchus kisutch]XP_031654677.1 zinc finger MYM-type protein 2 isoform X1 [Oncorhynchus kisutch]
MMDGELEPKPGLVEGSTTPAPEEEPMDTDTTRSSEKTTPPTGSQAPVTTVTEEPSRVPENNDNDDDVVLVEEAPSPSGKQPPTPSATPPFHAGTPADCTEPRPSETETTATVNMTTATAAAAPFKKNSPPATSSAPSTEPIVIDDEEDPGHRGSSLLATAGGPSSSYSGGILSSTEPDSEIKIGNVTTLGPSAVATAATAAEPVAEPERDMNLMITSVTSLQGGVGVGGSDVAEKGLQISSTFSLNPEARSSISTTRLPATFNPGRVSNTSTTSQPVQNGDTGTHQRPDSWISQSASFPRNQKQTGVDSPSPTASLPKPPGPSPSGSQNPPRTVKVTCANCKKPLKKGQTAYQRKGSTHLFCSTTCLSAFSHKPTPKKSCTMCKKDITTMKGTIVAQVDSSESFQEFCSTGCLGAYENKQNPPKSSLKTKCTVCGKLTEIRHEVSFKTVTHKICSDACFNRYRMANGLIVNCCEQCGEYLPSRATANHFLIIDGKQKRFCCQNCMQDYKQPHSKMTMCTGCSAMVRSSEVTHCIGASGTMEPYCSTACMNKTKIASTTTTVLDSEPTCHFCKKTSLPQYQATLLEGNVLNFCSSTCVTKFQNTNIQTVTNGQTPLSTTNHNIQLKCNYCRGAFSLKPETLEWEDKVYQFCSKICCEDYKKLHCIVTFCEYCQEEKTLHETVKFSGVKRPFCSEGCKLLFKQDFAKRLGLKCVTCNYCTQLCKRGVTRQLAGVSRDFCSETCAKKFHEWYYKAARCDCCKVQGNLTESVQWRAEMKHFCDQQCLLRFYCQQNEPNLATQKGPENTRLGFGIQTEATNIAMLSQPYTGGGILKDVKNKAVLCKPLTMTKATYCKPHMQSKLLQTDEDDWVKREYIPVPIPVPVFIPVPMNLYAQITPIPITLPVPVPVPVFLPTTLQGTEQIVQTMNKLKAKVPTDPHEADLSMAEMIAEDQKPDVKVKRERGEGEARSSSSSSSNSSSESEAEEEKYEPDLDLENDFPQDPFPTLESLDVDMGFTLPPLLAEEKDEVPRARRQGHKRRAVEGDPSPPMTERRSLPLRSHYGVNAWKRWALSSTDQSGDAKGKDSLKQESPPARSKSNLLSLKASELSLALSRFVREVRRPNGERYAPDSILYLCLGIQQHLQAKGRKDELFSDSCFEPFGEELNKVLKDWQPSVMPDGARWGCVEEQCLWSCKLLGEQSPAALLRSLVYLNTKYFGLRTVEQHLCLSFSNVYGPDHTDPATQETTVCIRVPSISSQDHPLQTGSRKRKRKEDSDPAYEPDDGSGSSSHCPVKKHEGRLYELYRSKCPGLLRQRMDVFYVQPEASGCSSDSDRSLWFSSTPLDRSVLESILTPLLLVKDIYRECHLEEEEEEGGGE